MILDLQSMFSDRQAITADGPSENVIDFGAPQTPQHAAAPITQDVGRGRAIPMRVQVVESFDNLTSLDIVVEVSDAEDFSTGVTAVATMSAELADLQTGYVAPLLYVPFGTNKRFARLNYDVVGTAPTTGRITAGLVFGQDLWSA